MISALVVTSDEDRTITFDALPIINDPDGDRLTGLRHDEAIKRRYLPV